MGRAGIEHLDIAGRFAAAGGHAPIERASGGLEIAFQPDQRPPGVALAAAIARRQDVHDPSEIELIARRECGADGIERIDRVLRSEEHTSELQSLMRISYAVFCLKKKIN